MRLLIHIYRLGLFAALMAGGGAQGESCQQLNFDLFSSKVELFQLRSKYYCSSRCHLSAGEMGRYLKQTYPNESALADARIVFLKMKGLSWEDGVADPSVHPHYDERNYLHVVSDRGFKKWNWHAFLLISSHVVDLYPVNQKASFTLEEYLQNVFPEQDLSADQGMISRALFGKQILNLRQNMEFVEIPISEFISSFPSPINLQAAELSPYDRKVHELKRYKPMRPIEELIARVKALE